MPSRWNSPAGATWTIRRAAGSRQLAIALPARTRRTAAFGAHHDARSMSRFRERTIMTRIDNSRVIRPPPAPNFPREAG
jgi:hypothetical protein